MRLEAEQLDAIGEADSPVIIGNGCNNGATVLPIAARYPQSRVFAVDAHPIAAAHLFENIRLNGREKVTAVTDAIFPKANLALIHSCPSNSGGSRLAKVSGRTDAQTWICRDKRSVPTLCLDDLLKFADVAAVTVLKSDVEGFECRVLESAGTSLRSGRIANAVCGYGVEGMRAAGAMGWDMVEMMFARGFKCRDLHCGEGILSEREIPAQRDVDVTTFLLSH